MELSFPCFTKKQTRTHTHASAHSHTVTHVFLESFVGTSLHGQDLKVLIESINRPLKQLYFEPTQTDPKRTATRKSMAKDIMVDISGRDK